MKRIIGIDIDGVLTDEGKEDNNIWHQAFCNYFGKEIKRVKDEFDFTVAYDISAEVVEDFIRENINDIYKNVDSVSKARETIKKLKKLNFYIVLITARKSKFNNLTKDFKILN